MIFLGSNFSGKKASAKNKRKDEPLRMDGVLGTLITASAKSLSATIGPIQAVNKKEEQKLNTETEEQLTMKHSEYSKEDLDIDALIEAAKESPINNNKSEELDNTSLQISLNVAEGNESIEMVARKDSRISGSKSTEELSSQNISKVIIFYARLFLELSISAFLARNLSLR